MYSFRNDYSEGACQEIMDALVSTNWDQTPGYGTDSWCEAAREAIRAEIRRPEAEIHFIPGGTQTNLLLISSLLRPHEAVIGTTVSHINVHETGAIEATGHKVLTVRTEDGILTPELLRPVLEFHGTNPHMVKPKLVYISDSTEIGTIYRKAQLAALSEFCHENGLILYLDGARLGSALTARENDLTMADIAALTDCFYIGGTKNGALFGEALVINKTEYAEDFTYFVKQKGALFAKGRLLGIQFLTLFERGNGEGRAEGVCAPEGGAEHGCTSNGGAHRVGAPDGNDKHVCAPEGGCLFYRLAAHANRQAMKIRQALIEEGIPFLSQSCTNQQFPILKNDIVKELAKSYDFEIQEETDAEHTCIRFVTSFATPDSAAEELIRDFRESLQSGKTACDPKQ